MTPAGDALTVSAMPRRAFTLIELLVVIAIIGILAALIFPAVNMAFRKRDQTVALSNMRQIGAGFMLYVGEHGSSLPSRAETTDKWPRLIAKYLGDSRVYAYSGDPQNYVAIGADPLSNDTNFTSFIYNGFDDLGSLAEPTTVIRLVNFDSPSDTILLGVPNAGDGNFYLDIAQGDQNTILDLDAFGDGAHYLLADGSARYLTEEDYVRIVDGQRYGDTLWLANRSYVIP